jgi:hypothetical protein
VICGCGSRSCCCSSTLTTTSSDKNVLADLDADLVTVGDSDVLQFVDQTVITTFPRTWPFSSNRMASGASSSG